MTSAGVLMPLRIAELGPSLGKLVAGTPGDRGPVPLSAVRIQLVSRLFEHAGEARRLAGSDDRAGALRALNRAAWLSAWEEAVAAATDRFLGRVDHQLDAEARAVRMPASLRSRLTPTDRDRRQLIARLGSSGAGLVAALDEVERTSTVLLSATTADQGALSAWQEAQLTAARRVEAAWLGLEETVTEELARAGRAADAVSRWRRPVWPVLAAGGVLFIVALWLGAIFGGYRPAPAWLTWLWALVS